MKRIDLKRVGDTVHAHCGTVEYKQVGDRKKYEQHGKCESLRLAKQRIRLAVIESKAYSVCRIDGGVLQGVQ